MFRCVPPQLRPSLSAPPGRARGWGWIRRVGPALLGLSLLCSCQLGSLGAAAPAPPPKVASAAGNLSCPRSDHGLDEPQLGWGFCYPASWKYIERVQPSTAPSGVDTTFDVVVDAPAGSVGTDQGQFGFMIIGTYEKGSATTLAQWAATNLGPSWVLSPITWGNSREAALAQGSRTIRLARTAHHVVELDVRSGQGNLNLDAVMTAGLDTWRFDY